MSDSIDTLFIATLKELKDDIRQLDSKFDEMHQMLAKNTVVLDEHERRSTASEQRLTLLEDKYTQSEKKMERVKGFFIYSGLIVTAIGAILAIIHNLIPLLNK